MTLSARGHRVAIGCDAGKGAAIGAGIGGVRRITQEHARTGAVAAGRDAYNRAFGACMSGKGYTVRWRPSSAS